MEFRHLSLGQGLSSTSGSDPPAAIKGIGGIAVETGTAALTCFPSVVHLS